MSDLKRTVKSNWFIVLLLVIGDIIILNLSGYLALQIRFEFRGIPINYFNYFISYAPIHTISSIGIFACFKLYKRLWRYVGFNEVLDILYAITIAVIVDIIGMSLLNHRMPVSFFLISYINCLMLEGCFRFSYRFLRKILNMTDPYAKERKNVMIVGAGSAGMMIIRELQTSELILKKVVCLIDDAENKKGKIFFGIPIVGDRHSIIENVEKYKVDEIIVAMPSAPKLEVKKILNLCAKTSCQLKTLPGIYQLINGEVSFSQLKDVEIDDLLGRETVSVDLQGIMDYVKDRIVLVTGVGSIGSELARQIAKYKPKKLVLLDIYENNAFEIQQELITDYPNLNLEVLIASVRDSRRIDEIFDEYRPNIVYHAAAHKHVPLMEKNPHEAIKNNAFGTYKTAMAADKYGVDKFVLISTDKAVNPTNVMGASKRICEMIVQTLDKKSKTDFVAVRFGNVLGSNGSVIPLFKKQIKRGGPLTVTDRNVIRYFMTIPEAVSLVLQTGALAKGGEIFVLDMGEPVKIVDLAEKLIRLSGFIPYEDIDIVFMGLRPGEKLYEEILMDEEGLEKTENELIYVAKPIKLNEETFFSQLNKLEEVMYEGSETNLLVYQLVKEIVPTFESKEGM